MRVKATAVAVGVVSLAVAGWWLARGTGGPLAAAPAPAARIRPSVAAADPVVGDPAAHDVPAATGSWEAAVGGVAERCDLDLARACDGATCVAILEVPSLDGPVGWARMAWRSPSLVAAVVAGDLGLPDRAMPCRDAIRDLPPGGIRARAAGEGEVWCLTATPDAPAASALCDALSADTYGLDPGFSAGTDRIVELRPPGA